MDALGAFKQAIAPSPRPDDPAAAAPWLYESWQRYFEGTQQQHRLDPALAGEAAAALWALKRRLGKADPEGRVRDEVVRYNLARPEGLLRSCEFFPELPPAKEDRQKWLTSAHELEIEAMNMRALLHDVKDAFPDYDYASIDEVNERFRQFQSRVRVVERELRGSRPLPRLD